MVTLPNLTELKQELKDAVIEGVGIALQEIKQVLPPFSAKFNDLLALEAKLKEINLNRRRGLLTPDELQRGYSRLRYDLLDFIDELTDDDFKEQPKEKPKKKAKRGSILYRIPTMMQLNKVSRCIIRLAYLEEYLLENIELNEDTKIKSIRIADVMAVELLDPTDDNAFQISTYSSEEQFLDEDDYTEWIFKVKPLKEGSYPLVLKVQVIEEIRGKERKRDIVMEEVVAVVVSAPASDEPFKKMFTESGEKASNGGNVLQGLRKYSAVIALMLVAGIGAWAVDVPQEIRWQRILKQDDLEAYESYIDRYPDGKYIDFATWKKASLLDTKESYLGYLEDMPEGDKREEAQQRHDEMVEKEWDNAKEKGTKESLIKFKNENPNSSKIKELDKMLDEIEAQEYVDRVVQSKQMDSLKVWFDRVPKNDFERSVIDKIIKLDSQLDKFSTTKDDREEFKQRLRNGDNKIKLFKRDKKKKEEEN